ncbi:MAG: cadherin-like beta sandwich domain-containing protein [Agathobacter sp.]|nr:cadherin-like beta sandwich domain-containing protein [Agathobacter sp.]
MMKKALSYFMVLAMLMMALVVPIESYQAYEANLSVSVSASTVKIGDTVTVTVKAPGAASGPVSLYFPTDVFEHVSTSTEVQVVGGTLQFSIGKGGRAGSDTVTVNLKAKTSGTATLKVEATGDIYDFDSLEEVTLKGASASVTVENQATTPPDDDDGTSEPQKSDDNSLVSLKLSSGTLSPSFKGNVTKYTATVGYDVTKVVVSAKTSSSKATIESVTGNGTVNLKVGENTIQIVVKAENGVKATYTIVVTRKAQESTTPQPSESESQTTPPEENEILQWNGEQLQVADKIPDESIPAGFESKLLVVNGQQMQGLSFTKGDLKVLYLNNTNGAGSLYVYDETLETIYPFIKLTSEKSYVMVLLPDEQNAPAPDGFESCTFSIEGKGIISAYQLKEEVPTGTEAVEDSTMSWNLFGTETFYAAPAKGNEFYLIYCMNSNGEKGWYMYDSVEGTFQRYLAASSSIQVGGTPSEDPEVGDEYAKLEKELNAAKMTQYIIIAIAAAVIVILIIIIVVLILKNRSGDDDGYWDEVYDEDEEEKQDEVVDATVVATTVIETKVEDVEDEDDDEIEIEFYNMEEAIVEETEKSEKVVSKDDDSDLEFIDFE